MALGHNPSIVTSGLVGYWDAGNPRSYPGTGTTYNDLSGYGQTQTLTNGTGYSSSNGGSLSFDGVDDYTSCVNTSVLQLTSAGTISAWALTTDILTDERTLVLKAANGSNLSYGLYFNYAVSTPNNIMFFVDSDGTWGPTSYVLFENLSLNTWYNVVGTWSSSGLSIYANGVLQNSNSTAVSAYVSSSALSIGGGVTGWTYWKGNIGPVSIYNRALTATEVIQNFNALRGRYGI
jgi:hypothetical protein